VQEFRISFYDYIVVDYLDRCEDEGFSLDYFWKNIQQEAHEMRDKIMREGKVLQKPYSEAEAQQITDFLGNLFEDTFTEVIMADDYPEIRTWFETAISKELERKRKRKRAVKRMLQK
jgi:hypothetical protein